MSLQDPGEANINLSHARTVMAEVEESRRRGELVDTVIRGAGEAVGVTGVTCHRLMLTAVSSVLRDAVMDTEEEEVTILVPDLSHDEVETFVQLIYTGAADIGARSSSSVIKLMKSLNIPIPSGASQEIGEDGKVDRVSCPVCLLNCQSKEALSNHLVTHLGEFKCSFCSLLFPSKIELEDHKAREHRQGTESLPISLNIGKNIQCTKCDEIFRWKAEFRRHSEVVHGQKISDLVPCSVCHKMIVSKRLNEHIKTVHSNEKNLSCQQCEKKFCKPSELRNHMRTHTGERPYTCDICEASFAYSHILTRHKKYHDGTKKFTCKECGKSFLQKNDLVKHGRIHSGEKPYSCETCGKDFARMDYLKKHQMLHASSDSKYCCSECGEIFSSLDGLKKHKSHSHRANIDLNSFDDLALQLPGLEMESMPDSIQAVSLDGGKTIMILNEVADMESLNPGASEVTERPAELVLSHSGLAESGEPTPVLYAVQY